MVQHLREHSLAPCNERALEPVAVGATGGRHQPPRVLGAPARRSASLIAFEVDVQNERESFIRLGDGIGIGNCAANAALR